MEMDYKIVEEKTNAAGEIYYQRVRFYTGAVTTENEYNPETSRVEPVTRYRRSKMVEEAEYYYG